MQFSYELLGMMIRAMLEDNGDIETIGDLLRHVDENSDLSFEIEFDED